MIAAIRHAFATARTEERARDCTACAFFQTNPARIEAALPGLAIMSSAQASVCGSDGLCARHECMINGRRRCGDFLQAA